MNSDLLERFSACPWPLYHLRHGPWGNWSRRWVSFLGSALLGTMLLAVMGACTSVNYQLPVGTTVSIVSDNLYLTQELLNVLPVNEETLQRHRSALLALTDACLRANQYLSSHLKEVAQRLAKRHQLSPEVMAQVGETIQALDLLENQRLLQPHGEELQQQTALLAQQLRHQAILSDRPVQQLAWDNPIVKPLKASA